MTVLIIGAGLTGLSAALALEQLGLDYVIVEKEASIGGLCSSSLTVEGFTFDKSMHLLHFRNQWVKNLVQELLVANGNTLTEHTREARIYFEGELIPYPFQSFFYLLHNKKVVAECIDGVKRSLNSQKNEAVNFGEYICSNFGYGIAKYFMVPYNEKLWTVSPSKLSHEWADRFVPKPDLKELLEKAAIGSKQVKASNRKLGYNQYFSYPEKGGIQSLTEAIQHSLRKSKPRMDCEVKEIDVARKRATLGDGGTIGYDVAVSTMPLPRLLRILKGAPSTIRETANRLTCISVFNVNFGIADKIEQKAHWIYFPQRNIVFHRVNFPHTLSSSMAPEGSSSLSIEISYSRYKPLGEKNKVRSRVIRDLIKVGIIGSENEIISELVNDLKYAYVLYDNNYSLSRKAAHDFLRKHNIHSIGRFGSWTYSSMEDSILEGYEVGRQIADSCR